MCLEIYELDHVRFLLRHNKMTTTIKKDQNKIRSFN